MRICLLALLAFNFTAHGAEALKGLTLEKAIEIAFSNHPSLAEAGANVETAKARADAAGKPPDPEAILRMESAPLSRPASQAEYVAGVSQPLPVGGRVRAARGVEEAAAVARRQDLSVVRLEVTRAVRNAFATALFASDVFRMQSNNAASARELVRITKARVEAGDLNALELARVEAEEAQSRLEAAEAERLNQEAMNALAAAMGDFRTDIESLSGALEDTLQIAAIRAEAFGEAHPAIQSAAAEVTAQEARVKLAKAELIPDVNLDLLYRRLQATREDAFDVGVRIPIPLFSGKKSVRQAESELRSSEARLERIRNQVGREQHELELALRSAIATAELLRRDVLPKTEQAAKGAEARYKAGDISLGELIIVRREDAAVRLRYAEALRSIMAAWAGLRTVEKP